MKKVYSEKAPKAAGSYSHAIISGDLVFTSGQLGVDKDGVLSGDIGHQTENAINNLSEVLLAAGSDLSNVVKTTCFLANAGDLAAFNEIYGRYFSEKPARSLIVAAALPKGSLVEIEAVAEIKA